MPRVTAIYATGAAIPPTRDALERFPDLEVLTFLDEALLRLPLDDGGIFARSTDRMLADLKLAADAGSEAALVTCNIYSTTLPELRQQLKGFKILGIDEPMVELATTQFRRLAVVGTVAGGLETQLQLLRTAAESKGREIELVPVICEPAFTALSAGDQEAHDRLILEAVSGVRSEGIDAVVLAQASMARTAPMLASIELPVLSSPEMAVAELYRMVTA
jgi:Asp/Glu/hydantoin racemase